MPMIKSTGNMYPWCTHTWNPIKGRCIHDCSYCYMKKIHQRYRKYWRDLNFSQKEMRTNLGEGNFIFVGSSTDMFSRQVPKKWILDVLNHCNEYPNNTYLFQSKNPERYVEFAIKLPMGCIIGTTIETNRFIQISKAPNTEDRVFWMSNYIIGDKMVSIEPIMDFDLDVIIKWMRDINPKFVSIGADSKNSGLSEPCPEKVKALILRLGKFTDVRVKKNLGRLIG